MSKQAFPLKEGGFNFETHNITDNEGMTLLEYYAGQSRLILTINDMEEILQHCEPEQYGQMKKEKPLNFYKYLIANLAVFKFIEAEAMVKEAEKRSK